MLLQSRIVSILSRCIHEIKDALLPALFRRHHEAAAGEFRRLFETIASTTELRDRIERVVRFAVEYHERRRGLLRALTMYVRAHPDRIDESAFVERAAQYRAIAQALVANQKGFAHRDPIAAAEFALSVINSHCRESLLFGEVNALRSRRQSRSKFIRALVDMTHLYLAGSPPTKRSRKK